MNKRLRSRHPAPLLARNQSDIYSVCIQQESQVNKVLLLCRSIPVALLLFVAHNYCALAVSRSMLVALCGSLTANYSPIGGR
jgi:hypothetical protein